MIDMYGVLFYFRFLTYFNRIVVAFAINAYSIDHQVNIFWYMQSHEE